MREPRRQWDKMTAKLAHEYVVVWWSADCKARGEYRLHVAPHDCTLHWCLAQALATYFDSRGTVPSVGNFHITYSDLTPKIHARVKRGCSALTRTFKKRHSFFAIFKAGRLRYVAHHDTICVDVTEVVEIVRYVMARGDFSMLSAYVNAVS